MRIKTAVFITTAMLTIGSAAFPVYAAGWEQDASGYWYVYDNGKYPTSRIASIDGVNYAFDQQGYMVKGWFSYGPDWYYFSPETGAQLTGWLQLEGKWYYLDPDNAGKMKTSWLTQGKKRYYLNANGVMQTGAFVADGYYYFADTDGSIRRNTVEVENGITIRYDEDGKQWYKNEETIIYGESGGEVWLPVLEDNDLKNQRVDVQERNEDYIEELKDELYEQFKKDISKSKGQKNLEKNIEKWKEKAERKLTKLSLPAEEINQYIMEVTWALYNGDEGTWDYTYTETNADGGTTTWTYTYWSGINHDSYDYDEEDDYDY